MEIQRHHFWSNFPISNITLPSDSIEKGKISEWEKELGFDLSKCKGIDKRLALRNCVRPEMGLHILNCARNIITKQNIHQVDMFDGQTL